MTSNVRKRCDCGEAKWPKCGDAWYAVKFVWRGQLFAPNLTRYAREHGLADPKTKTEAETLARAVRAAVEGGTYVSAKEKRREPIVRRSGSTKDKTCPTMTTAIADFLKHVIDKDTKKQKEQKQRDKYNLEALRDFKTAARGKVGDMPVDAVITADVIEFRQSKPIAKLANSSWAKYRTVFVMFFNWCKGREQQHIDVTPFERIDKYQKDALERGKFKRRTRRLRVGEYENLLRAAGRVHLEVSAMRLIALIVAAMETAMRLGELLALQWRDVYLDRGVIVVRAEEVGGRKTGEGKTREVPISAKLDKELRAMQNDPNGKPWGPRAYVYGDAVGERIVSIAKAWEATVLRAWGHEPTWEDTALSADSRAKLDEIDLEFRDLRRECASRWLESGRWRIEQIRDALGHATVTTTEIYLNVTASTPAAAMKAYDLWRAEQAAAAGRAAACPTCGRALKSDRGRYKRGTNAERVDRAASGLRLVSGGNSLPGV